MHEEDARLLRCQQRIKSDPLGTRQVDLIRRLLGRGRTGFSQKGTVSTQFRSKDRPLAASTGQRAAVVCQNYQCAKEASRISLDHV